MSLVWHRLIVAAAIGLSSMTSAANAASFSYGFYYEDARRGGCLIMSPGAGVSHCGIAFQAVPAGKRMVVTRVSCIFTVISHLPILSSVYSDPEIKRVFLLTSGPTHSGRLQALPAKKLGSVGTPPATEQTDYYSVNEEVLLLYGSSQQPAIEFEFTELANGVMPATCVLTGSIF